MGYGIGEKKPVERKIISASEAKKESKKTVSSGEQRKVQEAKHAPEGSTPKGRAIGRRVAAVILWIVGILFEVAALLILNGTIYIGDNKLLFLLIALGLDLIAVIIASQLWKKANHIDPASEKNKVKFFLWNNLGVIASIIAFLPILILLLKNKDLDAKTKKIASIVAAVALVAAVGTSIDYNPVSSEQLAEAENDAAAITDGMVYWTRFGKKYHYDQDCQSVRNSETLIAGTVAEAVEAKRTELCAFCAKNHEAELEKLNGIDDVIDELAGADDAADEEPAEDVADAA